MYTACTGPYTLFVWHSLFYVERHCRVLGNIINRLPGPRHMSLFPNNCRRTNTSESSSLFPIGNNKTHVRGVFYCGNQKCCLISKEIMDDSAGNLATKDNNIMIISNGNSN